jgi:hypothetical protein
MSIEAAFINGVVLIATAAAVIRFALFEWEGIQRAWRRATAVRRPRGKPARKSQAKTTVRDSACDFTPSR